MNCKYKGNYIVSTKGSIPSIKSSIPGTRGTNILRIQGCTNNKAVQV